MKSVDLFVSEMHELLAKMYALKLSKYGWEFV